MQGWIDLFRSLGESLIEVLRAESTALQTDLKTSGRHMLWALLLFGAAAMLLFWVIGLFVFLLITLLAIKLPLWASALIVFGLFVVVMAGLGLVGYFRFLRRVENPVDTVKRHVDDHLDWWQNGLLAQGKAMDIPPAVPVDMEGEELS